MVTIVCDDTFFQGVDAVFLDKDGTLADVANYLSRLGYLQARLMEQALPGSYELTLKALGIATEGVVPSGLLAVGSRQETVVGVATAAAMAGCPWVEALELAATTLTMADQQCSPKAVYTPLLPGVLAFLQRLKQAQLKVIMVSADSQQNLDQFVQHYKLHGYFDWVQGISTQYPSKVEPVFLAAACTALGLSPQQGVVIGDAASDLRMAATARGFIGYLGGWQPALSATDILGVIDSSPDEALVYGFVTDFSQITLVPSP